MVWEAMIGGRSVTSGSTGESGTRPERALEAINKAPRAQRESRFLPELPCERRSVSPGGSKPATCGRFKTSHLWAIQNQPV